MRLCIFEVCAHKLKLEVYKMAYKISYSPENNKRYPQFQSRNKHRPVFFLVVLLLLVCAAWIKWKGVPDFLIPGDKEITVAATKEMVENLRSGTSVDMALTAFCNVIIHGAGF